MNVTQWYAISFSVIATCLLLQRLGSVISTFLVTRFHFFVLKNMAYPLFIERQYWSSVTRLQGSLLGIYIALNGFCMGLGIKSRTDLMVRSGNMAVVNLIPLFLGGRTNVLANFVGISLHTYYLTHHWIGRIVIAQSLLHTVLVIASGTPWTWDSLHVSGLSAISAMALILLSSIYVVRKMMFEFFLGIHFFLAFLVLAAIFWHLLVAGPRNILFPAVALSVWTFNLILRLARMAYHNIASGLRRPNRTRVATITHVLEHPSEDVVSAMQITVNLNRAWHMHPGQYVYLYFSDMGTRRRFQSHPFVITWWDDSLHAMKLSFLVQPNSGITSDLISRNSSRVLIDGPYGKDLKLEQYETVILVAKGIGIAGILPYLRHMTYRKASTDKRHESYRRGLITRKIDVYWVLDDNYQEAWASDWLSALQRRDADKLILSFACFYPRKKTNPPPLKSDRRWRFLYEQEPMPIIETLMSKQIQRSPGKTKITVCGTATFSKAIRSSVLKLMNGSHHMEFAETEFQPRELTVDPDIHRLDKGHTENLEMVVRSSKVTESRRRLTRSRPPPGLRKPSKESSADMDQLVKRRSDVSAAHTGDKSSEEEEMAFEVGHQVNTKEIV